MSQAQTKLQTLTAKRDAAQKVVDKYNADIAALTKFSDVKIGDLVGFEFGRGEGKQNLQGEVVGRGKLDNGVEVVNVLVNKGTVDVDVKRIPLSTLNAHIPAQSDRDRQEQAEAAINADAVLSGDPLGCTVTSEPAVPQPASDPLAEDAQVRNVDDLLN